MAETSIKEYQPHISTGKLHRNKQLRSLETGSSELSHIRTKKHNKNEKKTKLTQRMINQDSLEVCFVQQCLTQIVQVPHHTFEQLRHDDCVKEQTHLQFVTRRRGHDCTRCSGFLNCSLSDNHILDTDCKHGPHANRRKPDHSAATASSQDLLSKSKPFAKNYRISTN